MPGADSTASHVVQAELTIDGNGQLVEGGVVWREGTPPPATTEDLEDQITPVIEVRNEAGAWEVPGDPQLKYFLSAGAVEKPWQGSDSTKVGKA